MQKRAIRMIAALLLAFFQLTTPCLTALAASVDSVSVQSAALTSDASAINGMVRVYLSSLGSSTALTLTMAGSYSVNGDSAQALSSGSTVTVGFNASTGAITLTRNGATANMGQYFALRRHSTSGSNGVKISQAKVSANPYPGDISFRAVRQSSGSYKLYTVAHVFIEDYLYGVLPYEMGNSSNIEALKAQAVAARTYTVRMMQSRSSGYYDVVDTTSDQVYRGTPGGNANCVAAVNATKGVVVKNGSAYTMTYYSASNGGQTESVQNAWGKSGYDYLLVKDDPFDYANTSATVKSKTVSASLTSASNPAGLVSLLTTKAVSALKNAGYGATASNTVLQTLKSVTPHTPKYASPSRLYTKMDFAVTANVGTTTASVTVTCDIFSELESLLGMSIQSGSNELWSVKSVSSGFTLQARRYGHGIGMSQRGAMQMGKLGYTYDEILGFYYNNCKRVRQSFTNTILSAGSGAEETTVEEAAELTGTDAAACKGTVKLVSSGTSLAIRVSKSTSAALIGTLGNGAVVSVLVNDGTWCYIQYGSLKGYVPANALSLSGTPSGAEGEVSSVLGFATVTANDYVNLRASGSLSASILSTAPNGAVLTVFSVSGGWASVQYCSTTAYVSTSYISAVTASYPSAVVSTGSAAATVQTEDGTGTVNIRATASTVGSVLGKVPSGASVTVATDDGSWASVSYNGVSGYMMSSFLHYQGESLENGSADSNGATDGGTDSSAVYATVATELAYLRETAAETSASKLLMGKGDIVQVLERQETWCYATHEEVTGYILTASLRFGGGETVSVAKATVATESGSLNMRAEARAGSRVIITIPRGAEVDVTDVQGDWCGVRYLSLTGYVMTSFLRFSQDGGADTGISSGDATQTTGDVAAVVTTAGGSLNLRAEARSGSLIMTTIPQYATVTVHARGAEWCSVTYLNTSGYVMTAFLTFPTDGSGALTVPVDSGTAGTGDAVVTPAPTLGAETAGTLYASVTTASGALNLRESPMPGSAVLARIPRGTVIVVAEKLSAWSRTVYAGMTGYVMNTYLTFVTYAASTPTPTIAVQATATPEATIVPDGAATSEPTATPEPVVTPEPTATPIPVAAELAAVVTTTSGSLNLRSAPQSAAQVLLTIPRLATVTVTSQGAEWCQVSYNGRNGYVMTKYLTFSATAQTTAAPVVPVAPSSGGDAWVLTASGGLNLRVSPVSGARVLLSIPRLSKVAVLSETNGWCQVYYNGYTGYVLGTFLTRQDPTGQTTPSPTPTALAQGEAAAPSADAPTPTPSPTPSPTPEPVAQGTMDGTLRAVIGPTFAFIEPAGDAPSQAIWPECKESGASVIVLAKGAYVEILMRGDTWCQIQYDAQDAGKTGYCPTRCLALQE